MGYRTYFTLSSKPTLPESFAAAFTEVTEGYDIDDLEDVKWYHHDDNMKTLSSMYPNHFFTLYGDGEDTDDHWVSYYYRGSVSGGQGTLVYPEPDYQQLGNPHLNSPEIFI